MSEPAKTITVKLDFPGDRPNPWWLYMPGSAAERLKHLGFAKSKEVVGTDPFAFGFKVYARCLEDARALVLWNLEWVGLAQHATVETE
jgi:hypothetical protein